MNADELSNHHRYPCSATLFRLFFVSSTTRIGQRRHAGTPNVPPPLFSSSSPLPFAPLLLFPPLACPPLPGSVHTAATVTPGKSHNQQRNVTDPTGKRLTLLALGHHEWEFIMKWMKPAETHFCDHLGIIYCEALLLFLIAS